MKLPEKYYQQQCVVHQKYFSITDKENIIDSKFLFVANSIKEKDRDLGLLKEMREF